MAGSVPVDSLEIQIEASSSDAEKKVNSLVSALERLKKSTSGFGSVAKKIKDIGKSASDSTAGAKTRQKREALDRATSTAASKGIDAAKISSQLRKVDGEIDRTTEKLESMRNKLEMMEMTKGIGLSDIEEDIEKIKQLETEIKRYTELLSALKNQRAEIFNQPRQQPTQQPSESQAEPSKMSYGFESVRIGLAEIGKMAGETGKRITIALGGAAKGAVVSIGKAFASAASAAMKLTSSLAGLVKNGVDKAVSGVKSLAVSLGQRMISPITNVISAYERLKSSFMRVAFVRAVRSAIRAVTSGLKEGIDNLYQYSNLMGTSFAPAMDSLATSALYLKNSLASMAAPLIEAIAPAVEFLVNKFVELLNVIGKVFAALTGKSTYTQAVRMPTKYAEATGKAAKATEDAKDATDDYSDAIKEAVKNYSLGIDELNVFEPDVDTDTGKDKLQDLKDSLGDLSGSGLDYGSMFEEVEIPNEISDFAQQIRDAIANGDWYSVGRIVAEKLNEIVDSWDSYAWGKKLGELITNGLNVAYGFLQNFNFMRLGEKVAEGINGLFDGINWDLLGRTLAEKWNALFNFVYGFATSLNWKGIGESISEALSGFIGWIDPKRAAKAISKFVNGVFVLANAAISNVNWASLGEKISDFADGLDFDGSMIGKTIQSALNAINDTVRNVRFENLGTKVAELFSSAIDEINPETLGQTLSSKWQAAIELAYGLITSFDFSKFGAWLGGAVNGWFSGIDFSKAGETISRGITGIFDSLIAFVGTVNWGSVAENIRKFLVSGFNNAKNWLQGVDWKKVGDGAWKGLKDAVAKLNFNEISKSFFSLFGAALRALVDLLDSAVSEIVDKVKNYFLKYIKDENGDGKFGATEVIDGFLRGLGDAIKGIGAWIEKNILDPFVEGFKAAFQIHSPSKVTEELGGFVMDGLFEGLSEKVQKIIGVIEDIASGIKNVLNGIIAFVDDVFSGNWGKAWDTVSQSFKNVWNGMIGVVESAINKIINGLNWMISGLNEIGIDIPDFLGGGKIGFDIAAINPISLPRLASGGIVNSGQMFIAREAGPELVGNIGSKTAVVNNDQIIQGISAGVENANEEQNALLREQNELLIAILNKNASVVIGNKEIKRAYDTASRQSGVSIMAGGVMG